MLQVRRTTAQLCLPLCLLLVALPAYSAEPYRIELHGGLSRLNTGYRLRQQFSTPPLTALQDASDQSSDSLDFSGDYYFAPVETNGRPLQEAAFLAKASALMFYASASRTDGQGRQTTMSDIPGFAGDSTYRTDWKENDYDVGYRFVGPKRPWIGIVGYGYAVTDFGASDDRHSSYSVGMGRYVGSRTSLVAEYGRSHYRGSSIRDETVTIRAHSLRRIGASRYLAVDAALQQYSVTSPFDGEPGRTYEVGATYYPRDDVSIALWTNGDYHHGAPNGNEDTRGYRLEANWFLSESIALGVSYQASRDRSNSGNASLADFRMSNVDMDGVTFNVSWRH